MVGANADAVWATGEGKGDMEQSVGLWFTCNAIAKVVEHDDSHSRESWLHAHEELVKLARKRAGLDFEEGRWLLRAFRGEAHARLGYGSFAEYCERLFGYNPRLTREKLRVAEALEALPETAKQLRTGKISFSAVRELSRVAIPETETEWLKSAAGKTVREVEDLVSGQRPGALPGDVPDAGAKRHVLRFEVSAEVLATFREAMSKIRRDAGESLDDDCALLLLARQVLGEARLEANRDVGDLDHGRASYQIALTICEKCRRGRQQARGEFVDVPADVVAMVCCDAQHIGRLESGEETARTASAELLSDAHVGAEIDTSADAHVRANTHAVADTHVGADVCFGARRSSKPPRAKQSIPPAIRRLVLRRDGGRCAVPGCRHATYVDVHHLDPRSDGGGHEPENLVTLCSAHHRANHRGELFIAGRPATGLRFSHADGTAYGGALSSRVAAEHAKACRALRGMGYREKEAKRALAAVPTNVELSLKQIIVTALREMPLPQRARF